jgi:hypothetical protein
MPRTPLSPRLHRAGLAALTLPALLAVGLTGCTDSGATAAPTPSTVRATDATGSARESSEATISAKATEPSSQPPMAWPTELYATDGHTYADYVEEQREKHGTDYGEDVAGEAWGEGVAEVSVKTRKGTTYWTELICAPGTAVVLQDSRGGKLESDTCETGMGTEGDGTTLTYTVTTQGVKPIRLVVVEMKDEESPAP